MELSRVKKLNSQRLINPGPIKRIRRLNHIKSVPAFDFENSKKPSVSKLDCRSRDEHDGKIRRFKTQQHLKAPHFAAVKTARERNLGHNKKQDCS